MTDRSTSHTNPFRSQSGNGSPFLKSSAPKDAANAANLYSSVPGPRPKNIRNHESEICLKARMLLTSLQSKQTKHIKHQKQKAPFLPFQSLHFLHRILPPLQVHQGTIFRDPFQRSKNSSTSPGSTNRSKVQRSNLQLGSQSR